jgi:hypothetical protein
MNGESDKQPEHGEAEAGPAAGLSPPTQPSPPPEPSPSGSRVFRVARTVPGFRTVNTIDLIEQSPFSV